MKYIKSPVLFIVFNRIDTTQKVFDQIKKYRPEKLYLASDGARLEIDTEVQDVQEIRDFLIFNIDWDCEVKTKFSEHNLGCKYGPQDAISWFFENEESGIILEDDCLPSQSFFGYCDINICNRQLRHCGVYKAVGLFHQRNYYEC